MRLALDSPSRDRQRGRARVGHRGERPAPSVEVERDQPPVARPLDDVVGDARSTVPHARARPGPAREGRLERGVAGVGVVIPVPGETHAGFVERHVDASLRRDRPPGVQARSVQGKRGGRRRCGAVDHSASKGPGPRQGALVEVDDEHVSHPGDPAAADPHAPRVAVRVADASFVEGPAPTPRPVDRDVEGAKVERASALPPPTRSRIPR